MNLPKLTRTHNPHYVSFFPRWIADMVDNALYFCWIPLSIWFLANSTLDTLLSNAIMALALIIFPAIMLMVLSKTYMLHRSGQTLGKMIVGIEVLNDKKEPLTVKRALFRELIGKALSGAVFGAGYLWVLFDKEHRAWHDHVSNSYVYPKNLRPIYGVGMLMFVAVVYSILISASINSFSNGLGPELQQLWQSVK